MRSLEGIISNSYSESWDKALAQIKSGSIQGLVWCLGQPISYMALIGLRVDFTGMEGFLGDMVIEGACTRSYRQVLSLQFTSLFYYSFIHQIYIKQQQCAGVYSVYFTRISSLRLNLFILRLVLFSPGLFWGNRDSEMLRKLAQVYKMYKWQRWASYPGSLTRDENLDFLPPMVTH